VEMACGAASQPAACSRGTTNSRQVSASLVMRGAPTCGLALIVA
jgi:hypothetical protein